MKKILALLFVVGLSSPARAVECPKDINPCKVMILTPQQHQWLAGTQRSSAGSVLDLAAKAGGSDVSGVIAQILTQARDALDGQAPKAEPTASPDSVPQPPADDLVRRIKPD